MMDIDRRLAVYGTLRPGQSNHHHVAGLAGTWRRGTVTGHIVHTGWGAAFNYPVLTLSADGDAVAVDVLESVDLPGHWDRLDTFEGSQYRRTRAVVATGAGPVEAWIYVDAGG